MRYLVALAALTGLGACSSLPQMPAMPKFALPHLPGAAPDSEKSTDEAVVLAPLPKTASVRERVSRAVELLNEGRREEARAGISEALAMSPKDATALRLLDQIDKDPAVLLGDKNETYVVAAGGLPAILSCSTRLPGITG
jgi:hypothetical protein